VGDVGWTSWDCLWMFKCDCVWCWWLKVEFLLCGSLVHNESECAS